MKLPLASTLLVLAACVGLVTAIRPPGMLAPPLEEGDEFAIEAAGALNFTGSAFFTQLLDHNNPSKGTFKQKFWYNFQFWAGPGSPIVLFTPGEIAAGQYSAYLTNLTLIGRTAQELKGAAVMVEHRYWGESSPYADLTAETLQLLTLNQAIQDFVLFAKTVDLPFDKNHSSNADKAPWVFMGGSYSGALTAWTESISPGTFWAYHASSAPVEAIDNYWQYFEPIRQGMAKNCSKDVNLVIEYMDNVFTHGNASEQLALKKKFGLEYLQHGNDVMGVLENGPWLWQSNSFYTNYSDFFRFCDFIENVNPGAKETPDENGVGLEKALDGYAKWTPLFVYGWCTQFGYTSNETLECFDTYNSSNLYFADRTVTNGADRQWNWMLCNEPFYYWQNGAPRGKPTLASRLIDSEYWKRQCPIFFPTTNGFTYASALSPDNNEHQVNKHTQGWRLEDTTRLIWTNGEFDPWRTSGVSSEFRPDGPLESRPEAPVQIIPGAFHCSDLRLKNGWVNPGAQTVIDNEVAQILKWVAEWPGDAQ